MIDELIDDAEQFWNAWIGYMGQTEKENCFLLGISTEPGGIQYKHII